MDALLWHFSNLFSFSNFLGVPTRSQKESACQSHQPRHSPVQEFDCQVLAAPAAPLMVLLGADQVAFTFNLILTAEISKIWVPIQVFLAPSASGFIAVS